MRLEVHDLHGFKHAWHKLIHACGSSMLGTSPSMPSMISMCPT